MQFLRISRFWQATGLFALLAASMAVPSSAQPLPDDSVLLEMAQAFRRGDTNRLSALLPQSRGHALEAWAAYWELKARLESASPSEITAFLKRWNGTYQEDRLRNDWLLLLGKRRDFATFIAQYPLFRMRDDRDVKCYALAIDQTVRGANTGAEVRQYWNAKHRANDDACDLAAISAYTARTLPAQDIWRKARQAMDAGQPRAAQAAVAMDAPDLVSTISDLQANPIRYLAKAQPGARKEADLATLALIKVASDTPDQAADLMQTRWASVLPIEARDWVWATIGKRAALRLQDSAARYYRNISNAAGLPDDTLEWMARTGMRQGDWAQVSKAIAAMPPALQQDPTWVYWRARALAANGSSTDRAQAQRLWRGIASANKGFYEKLAMEELGQRITSAPASSPLTAQEKQIARQNPSLNRALYAIAVGLRNEGVREWNYATNLHIEGGMGDRELYAAADFACQQKVWDRCINTSDRIKTFSDANQRFPMPYRDAVLSQARSIGIDPAYVYGLIRQESRFIVAARSGVGAQGLMQVMPATARWTARKIGLSSFSADQIYEHDTNILIGTSYLKLALDDFQGSMPMAAAAYNAGPGRPRSWRNGPKLDGAIWAENVPFSETRNYVKAVLSNTVDYAAVITGQPQSLKTRLGNIGPLAIGQTDLSQDLP